MVKASQEVARMRRGDWDLSPDSVQRALERLQPASAGVIVREAFYGTRRFDDFLRRTGLTAAVLSARLRDLERDGMLERRPYREPGQRTRHEYRLTAQGLAMGTAIVALLDWADRFHAPPAGPTVLLHHEGCGAPVHAALRCDAGHDDLAVTDLAMRPGPGARPATG